MNRCINHCVVFLCLYTTTSYTCTCDTCPDTCIFCVPLTPLRTSPSCALYTILATMQIFAQVTPTLLPGCSAPACTSAFRNFSLASADVVLKGQYGDKHFCWGGSWMRDDRIGKMPSCFTDRSPFKALAAYNGSLAEKSFARKLAASNVQLAETDIIPNLTDPALAEAVSTSARYALHLYTIIEAAWPLLYQVYAASKKLPPLLTPSEVTAALDTYDGAWSAYRAFGLSEVKTYEERGERPAKRGKERRREMERD